MKSIRFEPVRWMAAIVAVLTVLLGATAVTEALPPAVIAGMTIVNAVLIAALGAVTRSAVTPLAAPEDAEGRALVPRS